MANVVVYVEQYRRTRDGAVKVQTRTLEFVRVTVDKAIPLAVVRFPLHGEVNFNVNHGWSEREKGMELWKIADMSLASIRAKCDEVKIRYLEQVRFPLPMSDTWGHA